MNVKCEKEHCVYKAKYIILGQDKTPTCGVHLNYHLGLYQMKTGESVELKKL